MTTIEKQLEILSQAVGELTDSSLSELTTRSAAWLLFDFWQQHLAEGHELADLVRNDLTPAIEGLEAWRQRLWDLVALEQGKTIVCHIWRDDEEEGTFDYEDDESFAQYYRLYYEGVRDPDLGQDNPSLEFYLDQMRQHADGGPVVADKDRWRMCAKYITSPDPDSESKE